MTHRKPQESPAREASGQDTPSDGGGRSAADNVERFPHSGARRLGSTALLEAVLDGDPHAAAELYDRHAPRARALLTRTLGSRTEVDDLLQDTFIRVYDSLHRVERPEALGRFITGVALNVLRDELRRRGRREYVLVDLDEAPVLRSKTSTEARRAISRLYELLDDLKPDSRLLFVLRFVQQYELTEVADLMGFSLATAKRHLRRVRRVVVARARRDPWLSPYLTVQDRGDGDAS